MPDLRDQLQSTLGNAYTVERELRGGMSRVFLAVDRMLGRNIVVKVLPPEMAAGVSAERFRREIRVAASLQHPHIVPLLTAGELPATGSDPALPYYTMPMVAGESLRDRLSGGELSVPDAIRILRDIADALAFAHERGVVHRDVKPENVLLTGDHALVIDFGVAKAVQDAAIGGRTLTTVGVALGTPAYMAPEQAAADPSTDHRADIYAFGIVAYELLTGRAPFYGRSAQQVLAAHAIEQPTAIEQVRPTVPRPLAALVTLCIEKRAADRPQTAREIVRVLETVATPSAGIPLIDSPIASPAASPVARRWPSLRLAMTAGAAVLVVVIALLAWHLTRAPSLGSRRIAVAPFENLTNDTALAQVGRIAQDWITQGVAQVESLDVVPSTAVSAALNDASRSSDVVRRLAAVTHAGVVVIGSVVKSGDSLRISATVVDARSNKPIRVIEPIAGPASDPLIAISALRERLLGSLASGDATRRVSLAGAAPKYDAYRAMMDGWAFVLRQDYPEALPFLRRALQLDSNFALAHVALGLAYLNLGQRDSAERVISDADRLRDRLSVTDKLQVDAFKAMLAGDPETELRSERQYIARDSAPEWLSEAGLAAVKLLRPKEGIGFLRASDSAMIVAGYRGQISVLSRAYHELGDFGAQLSTLERGRKLYPASRNFAGLELGALAGLRRPAAALALSDTLIAGTSGADISSVAFVVDGANEFRAHGDLATAQSLARKVTAWDAAQRGPPQRARDIAAGAAWLILRPLDSAASRYRRAAVDSQTISVTGLLAVVSAQQGDTLRARATADSLGMQESARTAGVRDYWRAAILGQLGEREQAVTLLRQSTHEGQTMDGWHADEALRALHGYPPFDQLITPKG